MSSQQTNSAELDAILATELSTPSESLAASIPTELFRNILAYVGDETRLGYNEDGAFASFDPSTRREEVRHLSACALTCVYWAQLTRERMFRFLILRSSKDMSGLLSFLRAPQSPQIPPICDILRYLNVYYTLGDHPWFHNLTDLQSRYRISQLEGLNLYITGPATPAFLASSTRGSVLHPLFFATPRVLPVVFPKSYDFFICLETIHLPNPIMLSNLLQDCLSLRPHSIDCTNLTWDVDPVLQATPSSIGLKYACRTADGYFNDISGCTDNILVAAMLESVPHREFSQQRRGPYLDPLETSFLFDVMSTTWSGSSSETRQTDEFHILSDSDPDFIRRSVAMRLPAGADFRLKWRVHDVEFKCIASRPPHAPATSNNIRFVTYIFIDIWYLNNLQNLRRYMKTADMDWDTFLHAVRQFPHLRQIVIRHMMPTSRRILVEFLAHLGEAWFGLGELLGLYYRGWKESEWFQLRLSDIVLNEIEEKREEFRAEADAEKASLSELDSSVAAEESESSTHTQASNE